MSRKRKTGDVRSGEAGHRGHDRQPAKGTTSRQLRARSAEAGTMKYPRHNRPDMTGPGPGREECERSKGDAHHDQRETERDMDDSLGEL
jgi:hypothetical protein